MTLNWNVLIMPDNKDSVVVLSLCVSTSYKIHVISNLVPVSITHQQFPVTVFPAPCKTLDIVFVLDNSGSLEEVDSQNWNYMINFVKSFVSQYSIGPSMVQVAVVLMGNNGVLKVQLNSNVGLESLITDIEALQFRRQRTNIKGALVITREDALAGINGNRQMAYDAVVMITDGEQQNPEFGEVGSEASRLRDSGVEVFVVVHTYYKEKSQNSYADLQNIASLPLESHYFEVDDFNTELMSLAFPISRQIEDSCESFMLNAVARFSRLTSGKQIWLFCL